MYHLRKIYRQRTLEDQPNKPLKRPKGRQAYAIHNIRLNPGRFDNWRLGERVTFGHVGSILLFRALSVDQGLYPVGSNAKLSDTNMWKHGGGQVHAVEPFVWCSNDHREQ